MKRLSFFVIAFLAAFFVINNLTQFTAVSAQNNNREFNETPITQERTVKDRQMAATIRQLTNRSTEGLTQSRNAKGEISIDFEGGFQNVMLSRMESDGEPFAACVTSIEEANDFFGRNLETGEFISSSIFRKSDTAAMAAQHGMSVKEFEFYKKLIEDAAIRRAAYPDSATINIVNADGAGEGFNDPATVSPEGGNNGTTLGEQRLNLFNFAAGIWGAYLDTNVPIDVRSQFNSIAGCTSSGGVLGSAGTTSGAVNFANAPLPNTIYHRALINKYSGTDTNGATAEINATFNSDVDTGCLGAGSRFYYGLDNTTPSQRINLLVVLLHEMGHGLGFSSFVNGSTGALASGFPDIYTRYMFDRTTGKYWHEMTNAERQASALNPNNVFWDGGSVKIASGSLVGGVDPANGRVALYTPTTFQSGSSISHWSTAASPNLLMEPNITVGLPINLDLTRQFMRDIGWYRDSNADLTPDSITNVLPSGGTLVIGSTVNITWTNNGGFNRNVSIDLSTNGGTTYTPIVSDIANTGSFSFTVPNNATTQGRIRVREHNFVDPAGVSSATFAISTTAATERTKFDFDGDGKADVSVFRPSNGIWYLQQSTAGFTGVQFGQTSDQIVPADFDGDGKTDVAVFRSGSWFLNRTTAGFTGISFGAATDVPAPADFDGDGKADLAVFRPSNGTWYIFNLATNQTSSVLFGTNGDRVVPADYDGDGKADVAVFRPSNGSWYIQRSQLGFTGIQFGDANDKATPADFDGDGKADVAVFRPSNGTWYIQRSQLGFTGISFGAAADMPTPGDYDGDRKADVAVFRPSTGTWYIQRSTQGFTGLAFGSSSDLPAPNAFIF